jgi:hypothetical protein
MRLLLQGPGSDRLGVARATITNLQLPIIALTASRRRRGNIPQDGDTIVVTCEGHSNFVLRRTLSAARASNRATEFERPAKSGEFWFVSS